MKTSGPTGKFHFLLFAFFVGLASCQTVPGPEDPIARVNGLEISLRDYWNLYDSMKPKDVSLQGQERLKIRNLVVQTLVRRSVVLSNAIERGIEVSDREVREGAERFKAGYPEQLFQEALFEGMVDEVEWLELVRQNLLIEKLFEIDVAEAAIPKPSLEEALQYYQDHPNEFRRAAEAVAEHIVVGDRSVAEEIHSQLSKSRRRGEFLELARRHSIGPEATEDARIRLEMGIMPEDFDEILRSHPLNQISPVVETPFGFHILRVLERRPSVNLDFNQVQAQILEKLVEERRRARLQRFEESLIRAAEIEYNRKLIETL